MSNFLRVFVLTKREQRVIILIVLVVVGATLAKHYRDDRARLSPPATASTPAPTPGVEDDESATPDESP